MKSLRDQYLTSVESSAGFWIQHHTSESSKQLAVGLGVFFSNPWSPWFLLGPGRHHRVPEQVHWSPSTLYGAVGTGSRFLVGGPAGQITRIRQVRLDPRAVSDWAHEARDELTTLKLCWNSRCYFLVVFRPQLVTSNYSNTLYIYLLCLDCSTSGCWVWEICWGRTTLHQEICDEARWCQQRGPKLLSTNISLFHHTSNLDIKNPLRKTHLPNHSSIAGRDTSMACSSSLPFLSWKMNEDEDDIIWKV